MLKQKPSRRIEEALTVPNAFRGQARHSVFDFGIAFVDALLIEIVEGNRLSLLRLVIPGRLFIMTERVVARRDDARNGRGSRGTGSQPDASSTSTVG
ncbi:hypothetical protein CF68_31685 [Cupriavidus sp. SK-4]|nr:hypothetical protein CF68_31685 [Cupriavidus sp. SK-4]